MRKATLLLAVLMAGLFLSSCASVELRPLTSGETRLTQMQMPDLVQEDLPYDVILTVASDEKPMIKQVCFRWVSEESVSTIPCYTTGADFAMGPACMTSIPAGVIGSESFCVGPENIKTDAPGRLVVRIKPTGLRSEYNKLEGQAEYVTDGRVRQTNRIGTRVIIR